MHSNAIKIGKNNEKIGVLKQKFIASAIRFKISRR